MGRDYYNYGNTLSPELMNRIKACPVCNNYSKYGCSSHKDGCTIVCVHKVNKRNGVPYIARILPCWLIRHTPFCRFKSKSETARRTIDNCSIRKKYGANVENDGKCLGLSYDCVDDEPIIECKRCEYNSSYESEEA